MNILLLHLLDVLNLFCLFLINYVVPIVACDMEGAAASNATCFLIQDPLANFPWTRNSGLTPSGAFSTRQINNMSFPVTGPDGARVGKYYLYIEVSGRYSGDVARYSFIYVFQFISFFLIFQF